MKVLGMFKAWRTHIAIIVLICSTSLAVEFAGGTGEPNDPYQIARAEQLIGLGEDPNLYDKHFILVNDIDLDPNLPGGQVFTRAVIAPDVNDTSDFQGAAFTGSFDGKGYRIRHLTIQGDKVMYLGLFSKIGKDGLIQNLNLEDVFVSSMRMAGGLAGSNEGTIDGCYAAGQVTGNAVLGGLVGENWQGTIRNCDAAVIVVGGKESSTLGGLVGLNIGTIANCHVIGSVTSGEDSRSLGGLVGRMGWGPGCIVGPERGVIINCYSTCSVTSGKQSVWLGGLVGLNAEGTITNCYTTGAITAGENSYSIGGLVGENGAPGGWAGGPGIFMGTVTNCYATGSVLGGPDSGRMGGLVGYNFDGTLINCFWDVETSGLSESDGGTGLTTAQMQEVQTFTDAGWDFVGECDNGTAELWLIPEGGGYPVLTVFSDSFQPHELAGVGTAEDPYKIATAEDLGAVCHNNWSACYELIANIDLSGITWSAAPIGDFDGKFDGAGFIVSNLTIEGGGYLGLFSVLGTNTSVVNLGIEDANITGSDHGWRLGTLAAQNTGTVTQSYATGTISGGYNAQYIGGLVGDEFGGTIAECYATASVYGGNSSSHLGGLVGNNKEGSIEDCYACGPVISLKYTRASGSLVGANSEGTITHCYATGRVSTSDSDIGLGGLVGHNWKGSINNCFWDMETSGLSESAGGTGLTTAEMQDINIYLDAGWDFVDETINGPNDIWKMPPYQGYPLLTWQEVPTIAELIAHWRFDEISGDVAIDSAEDNHAALHQTEFTEGKTGGAILLNGFNSYVDCGDSVVLGPEQMTLTMWLEPRHMGGVRYVVSRAKKEDLDDIDYTITRHLAGEIELTLAQLDSVPVSALSTATTPLGEWSHLAVCLDGSEASIYINGQLDSSTNYSQRVPRQGYRLVISSHQASTRFYNGKIDDVRIYNGPLNEQDILSLANPDM